MRLKLTFILLVFALGAAFIDRRFFGYSLMAFYAVSLLWGGKLFKELAPGRELGYLIIAPLAVFSAYLFCEGDIPVVVAYLAQVFDDYFEFMFFGIKWTAERLELHGYTGRPSLIKAEMLVAFFLALAFSWRYIVACLEYKPSDQRKKEPATWQIHAAYAVLIFGLCSTVMWLILYAPGCKFRCSNIQQSSFSMIWIAVAFVLIGTLSGLWLSILRFQYVVNKSRKEF